MSTDLGASAEPVLFLLYLFLLFFYLPMGYPSRPQSSARQTLAHLVRDFRPLIPAHGGRRLHGRLGGWSGIPAAQNLHQPGGFPSLSRCLHARHDGRCLVIPVAVTAGDKIEGLRQWASGRCLSADRAGVYSRSEGVGGGRVRRVVRAD